MLIQENKRTYSGHCLFQYVGQRQVFSRRNTIDQIIRMIPLWQLDCLCLAFMEI